MRKALLVLAVLALAARAALPFLAERRLNEALASLEGYEGSVGDVDLSLLRGRVVLEDLQLQDVKKDLRLHVPRLVLDAAWAPLLRRKAVLAVSLRAPVAKLAAPRPAAVAKKAVEKGKKAQREVELKTGKTIGDLLKEMPAFELSRLRVSGGAVLVGEEAGEAALRLDGLDVEADGLSNVSREPARVALKAALAGGTVALRASVRPMEKAPTFDMDFEVKGVQVPRLNPALRWQWDVDVSSGVFELVGEARASGGSFKGYVKPFITDLEAGPKGGRGPARALKKAVLGAVTKLLENEKNEVASRVPFSGRFEDPKVGVWDAMVAVLRNAFVEGLSHRLEGI